MKQEIKKYMALMLKVSVSAALLFLVLQKAGPARVMEALKQTGPLYFGAAIAIFIVLMFLTSVRWGLLLARGIATMTLFRLQMLGTFFNTFMPGLVGGDAIKVYYIYKQAGIGTEAIASVFMDRYLGYAALMALGLMGYTIGIGQFAGTWVTWLLPALVISFILASLLIFRFEMGSRFRAFANIYGYFRVYRQRRKALVKAFGIALLVQSLAASMVYLLALGMGLYISPLEVLALVPVVATLSAVPISLGGVGIREAAMVLLLGNLGIDAGQATALSFLWYLSFMAGGTLGAFEYMRSKDYIKDAFRKQGDKQV